METIQSETDPANSATTLIAKCAHANCVCTVGNGERFCSDYCAALDRGEHAAHDDDVCQCGHAECQHSAEALAAGSVPGMVPIV